MLCSWVVLHKNHSFLISNDISDNLLTRWGRFLFSLLFHNLLCCLFTKYTFFSEIFSIFSKFMKRLDKSYFYIFIKKPAFLVNMAASQNEKIKQGWKDKRNSLKYVGIIYACSWQVFQAQSKLELIKDMYLVSSMFKV